MTTLHVSRRVTGDRVPADPGIRRVGTAILLLPRNVSIAVLQTYRALISPLYGDVCRYYPSCSRYALGAIQHHGVIKGIWLGSLRILRCNPWSAGGVDDVPENSRHSHHTNRFGFVASCDAKNSAPDANPSSTPESKHHRKV